MKIKHRAFYISNAINKRALITQVKDGELIAELASKKGRCFLNLH